MLLIRNNSIDPAYNLAAEEYLLTMAEQSVFMLWRNENAVIIGQNQNTLGEIDPAYVKEKNISVVRRLTGGGAVFHDLGNVNYTLIEPNTGGRFNDYAYFTADLIDFLATLGVTAELSGRYDVLIDGRKISGNAQCVKNGRVMHHGCILYQADLSTLAGALKANQDKLQSKGVASVASRVTNIRNHIAREMDVVAFMDAFAAFMQEKYNCEEYAFTSEDVEQIQRLRDEKYAAWDWNFGASPDYNFENMHRFDFGSVQVRLFVSDGVIQQASITGDFFGQEDVTRLAGQFVGLRHDEPTMDATLANINVPQYIAGCGKDELKKVLMP